MDASLGKRVVGVPTASSIIGHLVPRAGQQLAGLLGDRVPHLAHEGPDPLDLGAEPVVVFAQPVIVSLQLLYLLGERLQRCHHVLARRPRHFRSAPTRWRTGPAAHRLPPRDRSASAPRSPAAYHRRPWGRRYRPRSGVRPQRRGRDPRPSRLTARSLRSLLMVSRASVIHCPSLLLPGLSACPPSTSSKVIPCISREDSEQEPDHRPALCRSPSANSDRPLLYPSGGSSGAGGLLPWPSPGP